MELAGQAVRQRDTESKGEIEAHKMSETKISMRFFKLTAPENGCLRKWVRRKRSTGYSVERRERNMYYLCVSGCSNLKLRLDGKCE